MHISPDGKVRVMQIFPSRDDILELGMCQDSQGSVSGFPAYVSKDGVYGITTTRLSDGAEQVQTIYRKHSRFEC